MSNSASDPRRVAGDQSPLPIPPDTPVQLLRSKLRMMDDCIGRMMDASEIDLLGIAELSYLNQQLTHLGTWYVEATAIVTGVAMSAHVGAHVDLRIEADELQELTMPIPPASDKGGDA